MHTSMVRPKDQALGAPLTMGFSVSLPQHAHQGQAAGQRGGRCLHRTPGIEGGGGLSCPSSPGVSPTPPITPFPPSAAPLHRPPSTLSPRPLAPWTRPSPRPFLPRHAPPLSTKPRPLGLGGPPSGPPASAPPAPREQPPRPPEGLGEAAEPPPGPRRAAGRGGCLLGTPLLPGRAGVWFFAAGGRSIRGRLGGTSLVQLCRGASRAVLVSYRGRSRVRSTYTSARVGRGPSPVASRRAVVGRGGCPSAAGRLSSGAPCRALGELRPLL